MTKIVLCYVRRGISHLFAIFKKKQKKKQRNKLSGEGKSAGNQVVSAQRNFLLFVILLARNKLRQTRTGKRLEQIIRLRYGRCVLCSFSFSTLYTKLNNETCGVYGVFIAYQLLHPKAINMSTNQNTPYAKMQTLMNNT